MTADDTSGVDLAAVAADVPRSGPTHDLARARIERMLFATDDAPAKIGRYVLLGTLGRGGMGIVYSAYDPELDRKIAIKILHASVAESGARLLREAQALAKLTHPNVVAVHDVGTVEGAIFIAMEYVDGATLGAWLDERARPWSEVLPVLAQAARGLVAAHATGLVHRDFKPDNVMLERATGRVLVMDFGLARVAIEAELDTSQSTELERSSPSLGSVTKTGTILGTPAYMAPEQFAHADVDARSDQFSFCVAAWEALYGRRPFAGKSLPELTSAVLDGRVEPPPRTVSAPSWLHRILLRGLAVSPSERWPSMEALLDALERGRTRASLRRGGAALVGITAIVAAIWGAQQWQLARVHAGCDERGDAIVDTYEASRDNVRAAIVATGVGHAPTTAEKTMPWLDANAAMLGEAATAVCLRSELRDAWDSDTIARAEWCLGQRQAAFDVLVEGLAHVQPEVVHGAIEAAANLPDPRACTQPDALEHVLVPDEADRDRVRAVFEQLARAVPVRVAGQYEDSLAIVRDALVTAEEIGWAPLVGAAKLQVGRDLAQTDALDDAEKMLEKAYFTGAPAGAADVAADAATALVVLVGRRRERPIDALRWANLAAREVASDGDAPPRVAALLVARAGALDGSGAFDEARVAAEQALELRAATFGTEHPLVAAAYTEIGLIHRARGRTEDARAAYEHSVEIYERVFGPEHPTVAGALNNLGTVRGDEGKRAEAVALHLRAAAIAADVPGLRGPESLYFGNAATQLHAMGELPRAKELIERSIAGLREAYGPTHASVGRRYVTLGAVLVGMNELAAAREAFENAREILEPALGPKHSNLGAVMYNLADVEYRLQHYAEAKAGFLRALEIIEPEVGPEHARVLSTQTAIANSEMSLGENAAASARLQRVLEIQERTLGKDHADLAFTLLTLGELARLGGRAADAVAAHERALLIRDTHEVSPMERADAHWHLARSAWDVGEHARGRGEAERALELYATIPGSTAYVDATKAWLAEHE